MKLIKSTLCFFAVPAMTLVSASLSMPAYAVPLAYVSNTESSSVSVIDTSNDTLKVESIPVGTAPGSIVVSPDQSTVYVANFLTNNISVIDTATNTVVDTIDRSAHLSGLAINHDGTKLYTIEGGKDLLVINIVDKLVDKTIALEGTSFEKLSVSPDDSLAYAVDIGNKIQSVVLDNSLLATITLPVSSVTFTLDSTRALATLANDDSVQIIQTSDGSSQSLIANVGDAPNEAALTPDGSKLYVSNTNSGTVRFIDLNNNNNLGAPIDVESGPSSIAFTSDGSKAYSVSQTTGNVAVIDIANNALLKLVNVGSGPSDVVIADVIRCGDAIQEGAEQCDDGNNVNNDGCSSTCKDENASVCGNGVKEGAEECDDGNGVNDDECSNACTQVEPNKGGDGCSLSPLASVSGLSLLPLAIAPLSVALRRFKKKA